jgi:hypothetical protein
VGGGDESKRNRSGQKLFQLIGQRGAKLLHLRRLLGVSERAVGLDGIIGRGNGDLIGQHGDAKIPEDGTEMNEAAQTAKTSG